MCYVEVDENFFFFTSLAAFIFLNRYMFHSVIAFCKFPSLRLAACLFKHLEYDKSIYSSYGLLIVVATTYCMISIAVNFLIVSK